METPTLTDSVKYVIHNKALIQQHMAQHRSTWQPEQSASTSQANSSLVETFIRVRPLLDKDHACGAFSLIDVQEPRTLHFTQPLVRALGGRFSTKSFKSSFVFGSEVDNDAVYNGMRISHAVQECLAFKTRELSILAYGQTGTGKTYSTTALEDRVVQQIWTAVEQSSQHSVFIEAFEIRGNAAFDLLSDPPLAPVKVLVTGASDVQYSGLSRHEAPSLPDLLDYIGRAKDLRLTRSTVKNSASSRSHSIIRLHICWKEDQLRRSQINIVDLAGSERSSVLVQNDMETMKESIETNKSLSVLKDCVRAVSFGDSHIPWRGSRLTMALKNIFDRSRESGERANKLLIVACVSPSPLDVEDTLGTLRYVAVFQLGDLVHHSELKGVTRTVLDEPVTEWDHDQSVDYIKRNWSKLTPVLNRLLPSPSSTMADLLPLSVAELSQLCATPTPGETRGTHPAPDARSVAQAKSWVATYKVKMDALVQKAQTLQQGAGAGSSANAARAALDALSGRDFMAGETGSVTRVDARGRVMHNAKLK